LGISKRVIILICAAGALLSWFYANSTDMLEVRIVSNKTSFQRGDSAHFDFYLACRFNPFSDSATIPSLNHEVTITGPEGPILSRQEFIHRKEPITLHYGSQLKLGELDWNLCDLSGRPVPKGTYRILVSLLDQKLSGEISVKVE